MCAVMLSTEYALNFYRLVFQAQLLASGADDMSICLWDARTGVVNATLSGHRDILFSVCCLSPTTLASASADHTIKVWDLPRRTCTTTLWGGGNTAVRSVCQLDAATLASAEFGAVKVWDLRTGRPQALLPSNNARFLDCICSLTATTLVSCGLDGLQIWDVTAMRCTDVFINDNILNIPSSRRSVRVVTPRTVVAGGSSGADLWDFPTRTKVKDFLGHGAEVLDVCALAPDTVATAGS